MTRRQSHGVWLLLLTMLTILAMLTSCIRPFEPAVEMPLGVVAEEVTFQNDEITLAGTLTLPDTVGPHPALMLISGSGQQDRDETIPIVPGYKPFRLIAEYLTQQGIAVLRYDDRGMGGSTGDPSSATTADFAQDAEAGLTYLLSRPEINHKQIGLLGHSEGAIIAAMIAARNPDVAFVITMAGPAVSGYDLLLVQTERILRAADLSEEAVTTTMAQQRQLMDLTVAEKWDELKALLLDVGRQQIDALPAAQKEALGDVDAYLNRQIELSMRSMQGWMRYFLMHNPADDWAQIKAPVLALFGGLDTQVDQAQNRPALEAALQKADNANVTIKVFKEANHLFQQAKTGSPDEYATLSAEFVPGFLETIGVWLLARTTGQDWRTVESQPSTHDYIAVLLAPDLPDGKAVPMMALDATKSMLEKRMAGLGLSTGFVLLQDNQRILVGLPVIQNVDRIIQVLSSTAALEFIDPGQFTVQPGMIINTTNMPNAVSDAQKGIAAKQLLPAQIPYPDHQFKTVFTGAIFRSVVSVPNQNGEWQISFETTAAGAKILGDYTAAHINQSLVIALDGRVLAAPLIQAPISEYGVISGHFTQEEATAVAVQMNYGSLPIPLKVIDTRIVQE